VVAQSTTHNAAHYGYDQ